MKNCIKFAFDDAFINGCKKCIVLKKKDALNALLTVINDDLEYIISRIHRINYDGDIRDLSEVAEILEKITAKI